MALIWWAGVGSVGGWRERRVGGDSVAGFAGRRSARQRGMGRFGDGKC